MNWADLTCRTLDFPMPCRAPAAPWGMIYCEGLRYIWISGRHAICATGEGPSEDQPVSGASDPSGAPVEDVGVDHRGADVPVAE